MAFRYPLQSLLRVRQSLERQEELRLFAIAAMVASLRAQLESLHQDQLKMKRDTLQEMAGGCSGAVIQFAAASEAAFAAARGKLEAKLQEAERKRQAQLRNYQAARQKREILEGLRDRQEAAYDLELSRRKQQLLDELFLVRSFAVPDE
jgi:flagellar export protein FliJ